MRYASVPDYLSVTCTPDGSRAAPMQDSHSVEASPDGDISGDENESPERDSHRKASRMSVISAYAQVLRPDHWFKNVFTVLGTFISCLISSVNYAINEFLDAAFDAAHPVKRYRPVPSGRIQVQSLLLLGGVLLVFALGVAVAFFDKPFVIALLLFLLFGLFYNVKPIRAKEVPFIDVVCESVNNPLRLVIGWFSVVSVTQFPPISLALLFWVFGAFLMTSKRLAELRYLGASANKYRLTYHYYSEGSLLGAMIAYLAASWGLLCWQVYEYGFAFCLSLPLGLIFTVWWFKLTYERDSVVKEPERLFTKPFFFLFFAACVFVTTVSIMAK